MKFIAGLLTFMLLSVANTALADKIYRWTDENGQTHFGNQPPKSKVKQAEEVKIKTQTGNSTSDSTAASSTNANKTDANSAKKPKELAEQVLPKTISAQDAAANCSIARQGKEALGLSHNTRFQQKDGSFRPLSAEERAEKEKEVAELINQFCS